MTKYKLKELSEKEKHNLAWTKNSEDFKYCKTLYYACQAVEYHGSAVRDNSFKDLVVLGKQIERGDNENG